MISFDRKVKGRFHLIPRVFVLFFLERLDQLSANTPYFAPSLTQDVFFSVDRFLLTMCDVCSCGVWCILYPSVR